MDRGLAADAVTFSALMTGLGKGLGTQNSCNMFWDRILETRTRIQGSGPVCGAEGSGVARFKEGFVGSRLVPPVVVSCTCWRRRQPRVGWFATP